MRPLNSASEQDGFIRARLRLGAPALSRKRFFAFRGHGEPGETLRGTLLIQTARLTMLEVPLFSSEGPGSPPPASLNGCREAGAPGAFQAGGNMRTVAVLILAVLASGCTRAWY